MTETQKAKKKKEKLDLEHRIQKWHFRLELVRTTVPIIILCLQTLMLLKIYDMV